MEEFAVPKQVAHLMQDFRAPWYIAGGWAVDLFVGQVTRAHGDIEIVIFRRDQLQIQNYLAGWTMQYVVPPAGSGTAETWQLGQRLEQPIHEIHAIRSAGEPAQLEILLDEVQGDEWVYRRNPVITRPFALASLTASEMPVLSPEIVLLYKAQNMRGLDNADFERILPFLDTERRDWLKEALEICHPGHLWISQLS
jgi:hypothetical protein